MTTLMVYAGRAAAGAAVTRTGGVPLLPGGFSWPACLACKGPMQFLAQVMLSDLEVDDRRGVLLIFMCQNDPGMCDEWDPAAGGNAALLLPFAGLRPAVAPPGPAAGLGEVSAVRYVIMDADYDQAREDWAGREARPARDVLGQLGGQPSWVQADETPACRECSAPMSLAVQLEEGRDHRTAANFGGGGCGYGFTCPRCSTAAFLWQC